MLLAYVSGATISARSPGTNRVGRRVDDALGLGVLSALQDPLRSGRPAQIPPKARTWIVAPACRKSKDLGYVEKLRTSLAGTCTSSGTGAKHPSLSRLAGPEDGVEDSCAARDPPQKYRTTPNGGIQISTGRWLKCCPRKCVLDRGAAGLDTYLSQNHRLVFVLYA